MSSICGFLVGIILIFWLPISIIWLIVFTIIKKEIYAPLLSIFTCIVLIILFTAIGTISWIKTGEYSQYSSDDSSEQKQSEYEIKEELQETEATEECSEQMIENDEQNIDLDTYKESNPFPNTEEYIVNNILISYNEISEYPIDSKFIDDIKSVGRPLGKANITVSNGVYFIISYNDYNKTLFIDYQEETDDDSGLFSVVRDLTKAANPEITDGDMETAWEEFKTGKYWNHYDELYEVKGFEFSFSTRVVNVGETQYMIKSQYYPYGKQY